MPRCRNVNMKYEEDVRFSHRNTDFLAATWDTMKDRQQSHTRSRAVLLRAIQARPHRKASRISIDDLLWLESTREPVDSFGGRWDVGWDIWRRSRRSRYIWNDSE